MESNQNSLERYQRTQMRKENIIEKLRERGCRNMLEEIGAVSRRGTYKVSGLPAQDGVCLVELEDNSTITVSMATWNQIVQCGLEACGYTQGQKVKCVVAGQPGDREEEKRWEQL